MHTTGSEPLDARAYLIAWLLLLTVALPLWRCLEVEVGLLESLELLLVEDNS